MQNEAYKQWYIQGLQALKSADEQGREAAADTARAVTNPELKQAVEEGSRKAEAHARTIVELLERSGGASEGKRNKIMEGIRAGNREVVESAEDPQVRDAAVIAAGQIALHYYMAAYGSLAAAAKQLGMKEEAAIISGLNDEIKAQDRRYTELAESMINQRAQAA